MIRKLQTVALFVFIVGSVFGLWEGWRFLPRPTVPPPPVTNADLVSILLTGVTLVLAILAIVIGGLAIWGYQSIKTEAYSVAQRAAEKAVAETITARLDEPSLQATIKKEMRRRVLELIPQAIEDMRYPEAFPQEATQHPEPVADEYPEDHIR